MNRLRLLAAVLALGVSGGLAHAQMAAQDARAEGEAIGTGVRDTTNGSILANGAEANVPTYAGTDFPALDYVDDPTGLSTAGEAARYQQDYQTVVDPYRKVVDPATIDLSSATAIEKDPDTYLGPGVGPGGTTGTCNPLPPGGGGTTTYLESCNEGSQPFDETRTCRAQSRRRGLAIGNTPARPSVSAFEEISVRPCWASRGRTNAPSLTASALAKPVCNGSASRTAALGVPNRVSPSTARLGAAPASCRPQAGSSVIRSGSSARQSTKHSAGRP